MIYLLIPQLPRLDLHGYLDVRERFERRLNRDFDVTLADNKNDWLTRIRAGTRFTYGKNLRGQLEVQYANDKSDLQNGTTVVTENRDMSLGFVEADSNGWTATMGRQKINYGQQRLIGAFEWNNVSRAFDAVRFRSKEWDGFAGKVGLQSPYPAHARVAALQHSSKSYGTTLYVFKHDAGEDIHTLDQAFTKSFGAVSLEAEGAIQVGRNGGKDQQAWAIHLGATGGKGKWKPFAAFDAASGGSSATQNRTFDNLYPTNHGKFGIADMAGWRNIRHLALGVDYAFRRDVSVRFAWHNLALWDGKDAWYSAAGAPVKHGASFFQDTTGGSGRDLGNEFDLDIAYQATKTGSLSAGLAIFRPGTFVRSITGRSDNQIFGYVQWAARF